jgi:transposase
VIPTRSNQRPLRTFDHERYRDRSSVEQCVGWMKENRRLGTRYDKLSRSFLAMTQLAMISRCFRYMEEPSNRA